MVQNLMSTKAAHDFQYQAVNYLRGTLTAVAAGTAQNLQIGTLPVGAVILGVHSCVSTAVTGGGVLQVGSAIGGAQIVAAIAETAGTELLQPIVGQAGPMLVDTPVWIGITATATAGAATITVMYSNS